MIFFFNFAIFRIPNDPCGESILLRLKTSAGQALLLGSPSTSLRVNDFGDPSWPQGSILLLHFAMHLLDQ